MVQHFRMKLCEKTGGSFVSRIGLEISQASGTNGNGKGRSNGKRRRRRGQDIEGSIMVTLEESMQGAVRTIALEEVNPATGERESYSFKVRIPAGVQDVQTLRVPGKGGDGLDRKSTRLNSSH